MRLTAVRRACEGPFSLRRICNSRHMVLQFLKKCNKSVTITRKPIVSHGFERIFMKIRLLPAGLICAITISMSAASAIPVMAAGTRSEDNTVISADVSTEQAAQEEPEKKEDRSSEKASDTEEAAQEENRSDTQKAANVTPNSLVKTQTDQSDTADEDSANDETSGTAGIVTYSAEDAPDKSDIGSALGNADYMFDETDKEAYLISDGSIVKEPEDGADKAADVKKYDTVHLTGTNDRKYWEVEYKGEVEYIDKSLITTDSSVIDEMKQKEAQEAQAKIDAESDRIQTKAEMLASASSENKKEAEDLIEKVTSEAKKEKAKSQTKSSDWNGPVLSRSAGKIKGPSGNETYYNLDMSGVISVMRSMGNNDKYWVRDDGCKMLGDYIMCAANLSIHPRGSLVESSLGTCIVCDTGGFVSYDSTRLDIATTW